MCSMPLGHQRVEQHPQKQQQTLLVILHVCATLEEWIPVKSDAELQTRGRKGTRLKYQSTSTPAAISTAIRDRMTMLRQLRAEQNESAWQHSAALPQQQYWLLLPCSGALRQQHTTLAPGACSSSDTVKCAHSAIALQWRIAPAAHHIGARRLQQCDKGCLSTVWVP